MRPSFLSQYDKRKAFICAVTSYVDAKSRWEKRRKSGLTDEELVKAIRHELGIAGGCSSTNVWPPWIAYEGSGLKIWAAFEILNPCLDKPILEGRATMAMAREVFSIEDPSNNQLSLI